MNNKNNLISLYQQRLHLQDATFSRIEHEDAMVAIVYKITQPHAQPLILKICHEPHHFEREVYFLNYLADKLPVPRIIGTVEPEAELMGAVLMAYLPGSILKITDFTDPLAREAGSLLARIHLNRMSGYGDLIKPQTLHNDPRVDFTMKFQQGLRECAHHLPEKLIDQCQRYFDIHLDVLHYADGPCIVHRDYRPGNIIAEHGNITGIIDWSSARAGFAQEDFCALEYTEWSGRPESKKSFLAGYSSIRPVPDYQSMMPLLLMRMALVSIGFTLRRETWQTTNRSWYQFNRQFLDTFFKN